MLQVLDIGREQHQRRQTGGADGIALGDRLGRIAHGVQRVRDDAGFLGQVGHLRDAAGVVGHRAVGVERHDHAGQRQHRGRRDGDAEQARQRMRDDDAGADHQGRQGGRLHRDRQPLDHVGAVARFRRLGDAADRPERGRGVVFRDPDQQPGDAKADQRAAEQPEAGDGAALDPLQRRVEAQQDRGRQEDQHG